MTQMAIGLECRREMEAPEMTSMTTVQLRDAVSDIMNRAAYANERFEITRNGKQLVAIVPIKDIRLLEELEERLDAILAREGMESYEGGLEESISLEDAKTELGLG